MTGFLLELRCRMISRHGSAWVQTEDIAVRQDCLDSMLSVVTRFGEHVAEPWQLAEALLGEVDGAEGAHQKKGLACIRAPSSLPVPFHMRWRGEQTSGRWRSLRPRLRLQLQWRCT